MSGIVENIFNQKLNEIQSRVPVKINLNHSNISFKEVLQQKSYSIQSNAGITDKKNNTGVAASALKNKQTASVKPIKTSANLKSSYQGIIKGASEKYNVDSDLIAAVINAESSFNPNDVSSAGAMGLMQLMPATAAGLSVTDPFDPSQNINGGVQYLRQMLDRYDGSTKMALAAYNCGSGTLRRLNINNLDDPSQMAKLPSETRNYVNKIMGYLANN